MRKGEFYAQKREKSDQNHDTSADQIGLIVQPEEKGGERLCTQDHRQKYDENAERVDGSHEKHAPAFLKHVAEIGGQEIGDAAWCKQRDHTGYIGSDERYLVHTMIF